MTDTPTLTTADQRRQRRVASLFALSSLGVLAALIGIRVKESVAEKKAFAATLERHEAATGKASGPTLVHGEAKTWRPSIPVSGTLAPIQEADMGFKLSGRLTAVRVKVGDRVKAGQVLASLDTRDLAAQASAASAGERAAKINLDMAEDAEKRTVALAAEHAVNEAENIASQSRAALARAQLEQARAQAQLASVNLGNGTLAAPFSGFITKAPEGVGKIVGPMDQLFRVEDTSVLKLTATLSESEAKLVELGADVAVEGAVAKGKVTALLGSLDPQTRRVPMLAEIPNDGPSPLLAGSFVRATVVSAKEVPVLELPAGTLRPGSQDEVVVAREGKAHLARVVFILGAGGKLIVRSGIAASDEIVMNPSGETREGDVLYDGGLTREALPPPKPPVGGGAP